MNLRFWKVAATAAVLMGMVSLADAPVAEAGKRLVVKRFLLGRLEPNTDKFIATGSRGTTNAFRDNVVMFVFSRPINFNSVDDRTIKIGIPAGQAGELFIDAEGEFYRYVVKKFDNVSQTFVPKRTYRNRVIFDPTSRQAANIQNQNPFGFEGNSTYEVTVNGLDSGTTKVVRGRKGEMNERTFTTSFRTSDVYLQDYSQPSIVKIEASDAPGIPLQDRTEVDSSADIIAYFSEPMRPDSFDPDDTFIVRMMDDDVTDGLPFTPRQVSGTVRASPDGMFFTFRPVFGYGRGPAAIEVELTANLQDRSSNVLNRGLRLSFTSENDPFAPNFDEITETFETNTFEDTNFQNVEEPALWNGNKSAGILSGKFGNINQDIIVNATGGNTIPWWYTQAHTQHLYTSTSSQMGTTPRTISGFAYESYYPTPNSATYPNVTVMMGHNTTGSLVNSFTGSYSDTPVTVHPAKNWGPNTAENKWITGPAFASNFAYNGKDNVVLEINNPTGSGNSGAPNYWRYNSAAGAGTTHVRQYSNNTTVYTYRWVFQTRFFFQVDKSEAQSLWYDTGVNSPTWLDPIIAQDVPPGTSISITYQGAFEDPARPGNPDVAGATPWTTDPVEDLRGHRFIRFHVNFTSNIGSQTNPSIDTMQFPFIFF